MILIWRSRVLKIFIHSLTLFNVEKRIVTRSNLLRQKMTLIKKVNWLCMFFYMNPNLPMYVLQTRHEHLGSFHSLMFYLKLIRKLLFFIFAGSCCHNCVPLCFIASSPQYTFFGNWLSRSLDFLWYMGYFST